MAAVKYVAIALAALAAGCPSQGNGPPGTSSDARVADAIDAAGGTVADAGSVPAPDPRARTIYLAMPDRFANGDPSNDDAGIPDCSDPAEERHWHGGDLAGLEDRIPYLVELGVGAVWTTPVYRQSACHGYHGYWGDFADPPVVEVEPKLGTAAELERLIAALHAADIHYILDMIVNHAGYGARVVNAHPSWFHDPANCSSLGSSEVYCPLSNLPDFAHENDDVGSYLDRLSQVWVERFAIDGIRMDTVKHVPTAYFADHWVPAVRQARAGLFLVGEVFDGSGPGAYTGALGAGFDSVFDFALYYAMRDTFGRRDSTNRVADAVAANLDRLGLEQATWMSNMIANHDLPRFAAEMSGGMADAEKLARHRLALVALFTVPGIPQLYAGDEVGMIGSWPDNRRIMPDWLWTAATRAGNHGESLPDAGGTFELTARLTRLRREHAALWRGSYREVWRQNAGPPVWSFVREDAGDRLAVVVNNGDAAVELRIPVGGGDGDAADVLGGPGARVEGGALVVQLPGLAAGIYSLR